MKKLLLVLIIVLFSTVCYAEKQEVRMAGVVDYGNYETCLNDSYGNSVCFRSEFEVGQKVFAVCKDENWCYIHAIGECFLEGGFRMCIVSDTDPVYKVVFLENK